jgi:hypothetical protein
MRIKAEANTPQQSSDRCFGFCLRFIKNISELVKQRVRAEYIG